MSESHPYPAPDGVIGIGVAILLTLLTCGLYGLYWQYRQMEILNAWLGRAEFDFGTWLLLSILTCGIFAIYYEYRMAKGINEVQRSNALVVNDDLALICLVLAVLGIGIASLAIQQADINRFYGESRDV